jgi:molybdopterin converting factor small subunit
MPRVTLKLYATFRQHLGGQSSVTLAIEPHQTIEQLLSQLAIPVDEARMIFCNNRLVDRCHVLEGGETIGIFPAIGGG